MNIQHLLPKGKPETPLHPRKKPGAVGAHPFLPLSALRHLSFALLTLTLVAAPGCGNGSAEGEPAPEGEVTDEGRFGDPYQIVTNFNEAEPDFMPQLAQDTLVAKVTYSGGCDDHDFDLGHAVERDTARLWLKHGNSGDDCEALVHDEYRFRLPEEVMAAPVILLLNPQGGDPFIIKWGR